jgi:hypothetical protein
VVIPVLFILLVEVLAFVLEFDVSFFLTLNGFWLGLIGLWDARISHKKSDR